MKILALLIASLLPVISAEPFKPLPILVGGEVIPLYPPDSPFLNQARIGEPESYNSTFKVQQDSIINVLNIHNPSIEVHLAPNDGKNTGTAIILTPGGSHKILWVDPEGVKWVPHFAKLGISTIVLRNRLRSDGYEPFTDATYDAQQAIRIVRSRASEWKIDPNKIGIMGFSAGAELAAASALSFAEFEKKNSSEKDPLAKVSARPDFVGLLYPGPTSFTRDPSTLIPVNVPPTFIACSGSTDKIHAVWAADYFNPMLLAGVPNVEMHIYARGGHGSPSRGPEEIPYASWSDRFDTWLGDLGFLGKPGEITRAAKDSAVFAAKPK
jgi:hypothetical protein